MEVLIRGQWEPTANCVSSVAHWIIFYVSVPQIIIDSNTWLISCFSSETLSHGVLKSFGAIEVSSIDVGMNNWFSLELRFLILRIVLNRSIFFMKITKVFIVFRVLVIVTWIKTFVCMNWNRMKSSSEFIWVS